MIIDIDVSAIHRFSWRYGVDDGCCILYFDIVLIFYISRFIRAESRLLLKPVLEGMRVIALSIFMNKLNKKKAAVFKLCRFSLFS